MLPPEESAHVAGIAIDVRPTDGARWLERYGEAFATVENNSAFYRLPRRETFESWRRRLPADEVMAVKASRYLTHIRRLRDPEEPVRRMLTVAAGLGDRLGPVLIQLPPNLRAEPERLAACLALFPRDIRVAVEPRHESWWTDEVRDVLAQRNAALVWADRKARPVSPLWRTADWGYLRLRRVEYSTADLSEWISRMKAQDWKTAFVFFKHEDEATGPRLASQFIDLYQS